MVTLEANFKVRCEIWSIHGSEDSCWGHLDCDTL